MGLTSIPFYIFVHRLCCSSIASFKLIKLADGKYIPSHINTV